MLKKIYRGEKYQIGRPLSRIEEDGRKWLRRPKFCTKNLIFIGPCIVLIVE